MPPQPPKRTLPPRRLRVDVTLDADLHDWLAARVGPGKPFDSVGHAFACALRVLRAKRRRPGRTFRKAARAKP